MKNHFYLVNLSTRQLVNLKTKNLKTQKPCQKTK